jgi:hypothetical protein
VYSDGLAILSTTGVRYLNPLNRFEIHAAGGGPRSPAGYRWSTPPSNKDTLFPDLTNFRQALPPSKGQRSPSSVETTNDRQVHVNPQQPRRIPEWLKMHDRFSHRQVIHILLHYSLNVAKGRSLFVSRQGKRGPQRPHRSSCQVFNRTQVSSPPSPPVSRYINDSDQGTPVIPNQ